MSEHYPFVNTPLPYAYDALEPYIDTKTMQLHHDKHLQTYVDKLNALLKPYPRLQELSLIQLIVVAGRLPAAVGVPLSHHAGGVYNHRLFFDGFTPQVDTRPTGALAAAIDKDFGSFDAFQKQFATAAQGVLGSGYTWLVVGPRGNLRIVETANQETPLPMGLCPILNLDVWEHAYYLKHYNERPVYIQDWWHVVNWPEAEKRWETCQNSRLR